MKMRLPMMACLLALLPAGAYAQSLAIDFGAEAAEPSQNTSPAINAGHPASDTATSPVRARSVRHGEHTVRLIDSASTTAPASLVAHSQVAAGS